MLLAVVLAAGAMASAKAAMINDFGTLGLGSDEIFGAERAPNISFTDDFHFQVSSALAAGAVAVQLKFQPTFDISGLTLGIVDVINNSYIGGPASGSFSLSVLSSALAPGIQYAVRVTGTATGTAGGSYGGYLGIVPVPVPAALPLMLGALAGLGLIARRKTDA